MSIRYLIISIIDTLIIAATTSSVAAIFWYKNFSKNIIIILIFLSIGFVWKYLNIRHLIIKENKNNE